MARVPEDTRLPTEVELAYEVMSCNAMRVAQEPIGKPHPCGYFRKWGTYHSYDYTTDGPPGQGIVHETRYVGRAPLTPELLSGCRKTPLMAVGINPNVPGWWARHRRSVAPLFDDYKQYAHYFRYREVAKLQLSEADYLAYGGGPDDTPFSEIELNIPEDEHGDRPIKVELQPQPMYEAYQSLLDSLAAAMGWHDAQLTVGEDLSYGNMVAMPSAKWTTRADPGDPSLPPMTTAERDGIVSECFRERRYFLRQLFQSLPSVLLVFSQSTANAFIAELGARFSVGAPEPEEPLEKLMGREIRLHYGETPEGREIDARVIFAPHVTGNPRDFAQARARVVEQLVAEAQAGRLTYNTGSHHLTRPAGACVFCPMLEIGPCDYLEELQPLSAAPRLTADSTVASLQEEKQLQQALMADIVESAPPVEKAWAASDEVNDVSRSKSAP
ncbi:MAG: hypothetical protein WAN93_01395 [Solirubrobacteraceae bacterium]